MIHHCKRPPLPPKDVSPEYGEFLVTVGTGKNCHGKNLAGGQVGPDDPLAPNLTSGGEPIVIIGQAGIVSPLDNSSTISGRDVVTALACSRAVSGQMLTFMNDHGNIIEKETRSVWNVLGAAINSPLAGTCPRIKISPRRGFLVPGFRGS